MEQPSFPSTVGGLIERSARRTPGRVALTFGERTWTYRELDTAVGRVAAGLLALGLSHGDRVAAYGKNSDSYLLLFLGCARAGLVRVPVNFNAVGAELTYLLTQSGPAAVFGDAALAAQLDAVGPDIAGLRREAMDDVLNWARDPAGAVHQEEGVADGDLVQLLYTSGTTSLPKGAMLTHRALVHEYASCIAALDLRPDDVPCTPCRSTTRRRCTCSSCPAWPSG